MTKLAPIVLFVYNRPWHTIQTVEALQKNELAAESELFVYCDEAKNKEARKSVDEVREYIDKVDGFKKITVLKREKNWGLANSIIDGVTKVVNEYGKIIVLEDDLVTSPYFLKFMNEALDKYRDEQSVFSITGYSFSSDIEEIDETYFLKLTSSWSWATWKDKWNVFSYNDEVFKDCLEHKAKFNYDESYNYTDMVNDQLKGKINSWAIYWYASVFLQKGLTLYPSKALVENIGFDGSGTHCGKAKEVNKLYNKVYILTDNIKEKDINRRHISSFLKHQHKQKSWLSKLKSVFN